MFDFNTLEWQSHAIAPTDPTEMVAAMKSKDEARLGALRTIKAALRQHEIDSMKPLDSAAEIQVLKTLAKQRAEAAEQFRKGGAWT
jgi:uncharacterized protein YqeY